MAAKIEVVDTDSPDPELLRRAAGLLKEGEVLVCPTDTGYAFSASALDLKAIDKVFRLKGRSYSNPIHVAVSSIEEAQKYARLNKAAEYLARRFLPGALTLVLTRKEIIPPLLVGGRDTIGIRVPDNRVILSLAALTGLPLTTTSANISGGPTPYSAGEAVEQLGKGIEDVALVLDTGMVHPRELSTIIDLTVEPPQLLRQGRISWGEIREALKSFQDSD